MKADRVFVSGNEGTDEVRGRVSECEEECRQFSKEVGDIA